MDAALFGARTCEVIQPDGEIVEYVVRDAEPFPEEAAAWILVKDNDCEHRVSAYPRMGPNRIRCDGTGRYYACSCGDYRHKFRTVRGHSGPCKHLSGIIKMMSAEATDGGSNSRRAGQGLAGHGGPLPPNPDERVHDQAADFRRRLSEAEGTQS